MVFFTADTHFNHYNILCHCDRPFKNLAEMDEAIVERWNKVVRPNECVYHLGDFGFSTAKDASKYISRLNGKIHLILGNHDGRSIRRCPDFASKEKLVELTVRGQRIVLCHYAMRSWNRSCHGSWHLYGHSHGKLEDDLASLSLDVGVDSWDFTPLSFEDVEAAMRLRQKRIAKGEVR